MWDDVTGLCRTLWIYTIGTASVSCGVFDYRYQDIATGMYDREESEVA